MMRPRRTARVMVFDPGGRVLLIRCVVMRSDGEFVFWLTPGGEIEAGESPVEAARRELREELGLSVEVVGPVYEEATQFEHQGEMRDNLDFVFVARRGTDAVELRGVTAEEIAIMKEIRWWTQAEVEAAGNSGEERIFPVDLAGRMRQFGGVTG
ncbi:MAG: NUDIX domain-containing protein [Acidobacteriota bacterium]|nr:NUDIX domain-containing protein [Acidobacteriota bacterium]